MAPSKEQILEQLRAFLMKRKRKRRSRKAKPKRKKQKRRNRWTRPVLPVAPTIAAAAPGGGTTVVAVPAGVAPNTAPHIHVAPTRPDPGPPAPPAAPALARPPTPRPSPRLRTPAPSPRRRRRSSAGSEAAPVGMVVPSTAKSELRKRLHSQSEGFNEERRQLEEETRRLERRALDLEAQADALREFGREKDKTKEKLIDELKGLRSQNNDLEQQIKNASSTNEKAILEKAQSQVEALKQEAMAKIKEIDVSRRTVAEQAQVLERQLEAVTQEKGAVEQELQQALESKRALEEEFQTYADETKGAFDELEAEADYTESRLRSERNVLREEKEYLHQEFVRAQNQLNKLRRDYASQAEQMKDVGAALQQHARDRDLTQQQFKELQAKYSRVTEEVMQKGLRLKEQQADLEAMQQDIQNANSREGFRGTADPSPARNRGTPVPVYQSPSRTVRRKLQLPTPSTIGRPEGAPRVVQGVSSKGGPGGPFPFATPAPRTAKKASTSADPAPIVGSAPKPALSSEAAQAARDKERGKLLRPAALRETNQPYRSMAERAREEQLGTFAAVPEEPEEEEFADRPPLRNMNTTRASKSRLEETLMGTAFPSQGSTAQFGFTSTLGTNDPSSVSSALPGANSRDYLRDLEDTASTAASASQEEKGPAEEQGINKLAAGSRELAKKGLSDAELKKLVVKTGGATARYFVGVYSRDELPSLILPHDRPSSMVINTDPSTKEGEHWVAMFIDPRKSAMTAEYFDSLGHDPSPAMNQSITLMLKSNFANLDTMLKFKINSVKTQNASTPNCGFFALRFITQRSNGVPFATASGFNKVVNTSQQGQGEQTIRNMKRKFGYV
jgi:hypothetical protein